MISEPNPTQGKLILVPTPIGNLGDITLRAIEVLKSVDVILAEDTRHTLKLLSHLGISKTMESFHQHNEHRKVESVIERLKQGQQMAYCSDAGTPGISDPGYLLAKACREHDIHLESLPGASAVFPALVGSGIPCDRFVFEGFLPAKKGRQKRLLTLEDEDRTTVYFESPHRLVKTVKQILDVIGNERQLCVVKELTKMHEQYILGTGSDILDKLEKATIKGEFAIVVEGKKK